MPRTKSILVVEDDELVRKFVRTILSTFGYGEVLEAEDAARALSILQAHPAPIHLLISDIVMPGELDGRGLAKRINNSRPETRILLMSGFQEHGARDLPEGWHFIRKPFAPAALRETVQQILNVQHAP
jgi:DNA-binding NtrC family response regulator